MHLIQSDFLLACATTTINPHTLLPSWVSWVCWLSQTKTINTKLLLKEFYLQPSQYKNSSTRNQVEFFKLIKICFMSIYNY